MDRTGREGLDRCDDRFIRELYMALTGSGASTDDDLREGLRERLSDEQVSSVKRSYLLCLSVSETVRRLHDDPTETFDCPVCGEDCVIHLGECDVSKHSDHQGGES